LIACPAKRQPPHPSLLSQPVPPNGLNRDPHFCQVHRIVAVFHDVSRSNHSLNLPLVYSGDMKRNLLVCLLGGVGAAAATAQPVAWWKFDEASGSTASASAGSINGALVGSASFTTGISGNAISVTQAGSGFVTFGNNFGFVGTSYSMGFWMKSSTTAPDQILLGKHTSTVVSGHLLGMNQNGPYGSPNKAWAYQSALPGNQPISTTSINDDVWHHIGVTFDFPTNQHKLYVDGVLESTQPASPMAATTAEFLIGGVNTTSGGRLALYTGLIDDLQLYDFALSDTDVRFLSQNAGQAVPEPATMVLLGAAGLAWMRRRRA
jgi:hypothetical protein